jgi:hypothetical protein
MKRTTSKKIQVKKSRKSKSNILLLKSAAIKRSRRTPSLDRATALLSQRKNQRWAAATVSKEGSPLTKRVKEVQLLPNRQRSEARLNPFKKRMKMRLRLPDLTCQPSNLTITLNRRRRSLSSRILRSKASLSPRNHLRNLSHNLARRVQCPKILHLRWPKLPEAISLCQRKVSSVVTLKNPKT